MVDCNLSANASLSSAKWERDKDNSCHHSSKIGMSLSRVKSGASPISSTAWEEEEEEVEEKEDDAEEEEEEENEAGADSLCDFAALSANVLAVLANLFRSRPKDA